MVNVSKFAFERCYRYESALLLNKLFDVPVFPVFLAELQEDKDHRMESVPFSFSHNFPEGKHK
jgi:hypothetical protein